MAKTCTASIGPAPLRRLSYAEYQATTPDLRCERDPERSAARRRRHQRRRPLLPRRNVRG